MILKERRNIINLLYIVNHEKYLEYSRNGILKYIPYGFYPKIKPRIIDDIIKDDNIIGKIAGLNMKPISFSCEKELEEYIIGIKKLEVEDFTGLYLEEGRNLSKDVKNYIGNEVGLKIISNEETKSTLIPLVIQKIYNVLNERLENKEILVISNNKEYAKKVIREVAKISKFITTFGCNMKESEEIYEYVLEETGLSLFNSSNIDKILGKYSIIINDADDLKLKSSKIKKNTIIIDFNRDNCFDHEKNNGSRLYQIRDLGFDLKDLGIHSNKWLHSKVDMELYDLINEGALGKVKYLYVENSWYSIKDYTNYFLKVRGKL